MHVSKPSATVTTSLDPTRKEQDKLLFTPGPLTTSYTTKMAATRDLGSRDTAFIKTIEAVQAGLLKVAGVSPTDWVAVPMQGSGTFCVEGTLSSVVPRNKSVLIVANGAYGLRMTQMAKANGIDFTLLECPDDTPPSNKDIEKILATDGGKHSHVAMVHSETTSGIVNDVHSAGQIVHKHGRSFIVDAMSSFGAIPVDLETAHVDFIVSSANKCIEGIPGFSFCIARKSKLALAKGNARTLSLDLEAQAAGLAANKQFRFTPPTHSILAFRQALTELEMEGGVKGRGKRYAENQQVFQKGMEKMGFKLYLPVKLQGYIISSYHYPKDANWNFDKFYNGLNDKGFVIYPGKVSKADCFRIGHIGRLFPADTENLLKAIDEVCRQMKTAHHFK